MKKRPHFLYQDRTIISQKVEEAFSSVLPITIIVLALCFTIVPLDSGMFLAFILGALCMTDSVYGMAQSGGQNVLIFILVGLVGFNFFFEFVFNLLVSPAIHRVITIVRKRFKGFKEFEL